MPEELPEQISNLNPELFTWDIFVIVAVLIVTFVWFYTKGRDFIVTMILGTYAAATTLAFAPLIKNLNLDLGFEQYKLTFIIFILLIAFFSWIMSTNGYFEPYIIPSGWEIPVFAVLFAGLILAISASFVPEAAVAEFSPITRFLFAHEAAATAWIVVPIGVLLFIRGET